MEVVVCEIHDKVCLLKTGTTPGTPQFQKSVYLCSHYPRECQFKKLAKSIPVSYCLKHEDEICDLQKIKFDYLKNKVHYYRCKKHLEVGNQNWCGTQMSKSNEKENSEVKKPDSSTSKIESSVKAKAPLSTLSKETLQHKLFQQKKLMESVNINKLPDKGQKLLENIDKIQSQLFLLQIKPNLIEKQEVSLKVSAVESEDDPNITTSAVESKDEPIITASIVELKDEPSITASALESKDEPSITVSVAKQLLAAPKLKVLPMEENSKTYSKSIHKVKFINELPLSTGFSSQYQSGMSYVHQFYEGRMTQNKIKEVKSATEDAIVSLHKSLQACPSPSEEEPDPEGLRTSLKPHQRQALKWLLWREEQNPKGGILADDMGLGKTLTMLALILKDVEKGVETVQNEDNGVYQAKTTLIVCPASLIYTWENEIIHHCKFRAFPGNILIYHGPKRETNVKRLVTYYVIITSYNVVQKEVGAPKIGPGQTAKDIWSQSAAKEDDNFTNSSSPLMTVKWNRIILDEGHTIKNPKTSTGLAVSRLKSRNRWVVTGTPIHNTILDMYGLLRFLRYAPFDEYQVWKNWMANSSSTNRLNKLVKGILLKRNKDQVDENGIPIVELPNKTVEVHKLNLEGIEKEVYEKIKNYSRSALKYLLNKKENAQTEQPSDPKNKVNAAQLLGLLTRMQQCCTHLYLLKPLLDGSKDTDLTEDEEMANLINDLAKMNLEQPKTASNEKSSIDLSCYKDNNNFKIDALSNKISRLLEETRNILKEKDDKCVVVSQWTTSLRIIGFHLKKENIKYSVIQGDVNLDQRNKIMQDFNANPKGPRVILLSLRAGGVGLNLTGANHLFLIDTHWNPALEKQACDRIYRIGQTKDVKIHKFICSETIEEQIMKLQQHKLSLASQILEGNADKNAQNFTLQDLKVLFGIS